MSSGARPPLCGLLLFASRAVLLCCTRGTALRSWLQRHCHCPARLPARCPQVLNGMQDAPVISVIAFRGQNRSEAQYIRSNSSTETQGTGIVQQLSLLVSWDRGAFAGFNWYNGGPCDSCGGPTGGTCVQTQYEPSYQQYTQSGCACEFAGGGGGGAGTPGQMVL